MSKYSFNEKRQLQVRMAILESQIKTANNKVDLLETTNKKMNSIIKSLINHRLVSS